MKICLILIKFNNFALFMKLRKKMTQKIIIVFLLIMMSFFDTFAQRARTTAVVHDTLSTKERISIHTNAVDWLLLTPNIGVEVDLSNMDYGRKTIMFSGKWNGNSPHTFKPAWVYNRAEFRGEFRHYFRTEPGGILKVNDTTKVSIKDYWNYYTGRRKKNPRIWRAYYWGAYASYGKYSIKLAKEGKQGSYISAGGSFGFGMPLYSYKNNNSIDLEIGGSLGFVFTQYDAFTHDAESNCYPRLPEKSKGWHLKPYPIPTNLHVSFVYRFHGIKNKYKAINHELVEKKQAERAAREARRDSINTIKKAEKAAKQAVKDSIQQIKDTRKEEIRSMIESRKDSLANSNLPTDSIKAMERKLKLQAKEEEKRQKEQEKAAKEKVRLEKKGQKKNKKEKKAESEETDVTAIKEEEEKE